MRLWIVSDSFFAVNADFRGFLPRFPEANAQLFRRQKRPRISRGPKYES